MNHRDVHDTKWFTSSTFGVGADNPVDICGLTKPQVDNQIAFEVPGLSQFNMTVEIDKGWVGSGRNVQFTGVTNLVCLQERIGHCLYTTTTTTTTTASPLDSLL